MIAMSEKTSVTIEPFLYWEASVDPPDYNSRMKKPAKFSGAAARESKIAGREKIVNRPPLTLCATPKQPQRTAPDETN